MSNQPRYISLLSTLTSTLAHLSDNAVLLTSLLLTAGLTLLAGKTFLTQRRSSLLNVIKPLTPPPTYSHLPGTFLHEQAVLSALRIGASTGQIVLVVSPEAEYTRGVVASSLSSLSSSQSSSQSSPSSQPTTTTTPPPLPAKVLRIQYTGSPIIDAHSWVTSLDSEQGKGVSTTVFGVLASLRSLISSGDVSDDAHHWSSSNLLERMAATAEEDEVDRALIRAGAEVTALNLGAQMERVREGGNRTIWMDGMYRFEAMAGDGKVGALLMTLFREYTVAYAQSSPLIATVTPSFLHAHYRPALAAGRALVVVLSDPDVETAASAYAQMVALSPHPSPPLFEEAHALWGTRLTDLQACALGNAPPTPDSALASYLSSYLLSVMNSPLHCSPLPYTGLSHSITSPSWTCAGATALLTALASSPTGSVPYTQAIDLLSTLPSGGGDCDAGDRDDDVADEGGANRIADGETSFLGLLRAGIVWMGGDGSVQFTRPIFLHLIRRLLHPPSTLPST